MSEQSILDIGDIVYHRNKLSNLLEIFQVIKILGGSLVLLSNNIKIYKFLDSQGRSIVSKTSYIKSDYDNFYYIENENLKNEYEKQELKRYIINYIKTVSISASMLNKLNIEDLRILKQCLEAIK